MGLAKGTTLLLLSFLSRSIIPSTISNFPSTYIPTSHDKKPYKTPQRNHYLSKFNIIRSSSTSRKAPSSPIDSKKVNRNATRYKEKLPSTFGQSGIMPRLAKTKLFPYIYWGGMSKVMRLFPLMFCTWITKHVSHFNSTNS